MSTEVLDSRAVTKERFGELVRSARVQKGLSLRALADRAGLDHSRLARIEQGTRPVPDLADIRTLSHLLSLDLHDLLVSAGTTREVVEEILWVERTRMAKAFSDLEAYRPEAPDLLAKNTFLVPILSRDGAVCRVAMGRQEITVLSFSPGAEVLISIPPEVIVVLRAGANESTISVENRIPLIVRKIRRVGQVTNLVLEGNGFELNSLHTHRAVDPLKLEIGDRIEAWIPAAAIHTSRPKERP